MFVTLWKPPGRSIKMAMECGTSREERLVLTCPPATQGNELPEASEALWGEQLFMYIGGLWQPQSVCPMNSSDCANNGLVSAVEMEETR